MPYPSLPQLPTLAPPSTGPLSLPQATRRKKRPKLSEEEQASLLDTIMSGVEYVAYGLDKPGAAVRGTASGLTGGPWGGGLLNLIPFSGTMGLTDPKKRVWGQDLLHQWGLTKKNRPGLHFDDPADLVGDVAGLATEIVSDPLFWMTGPLGTVVKGGAKAATKAGARAGTAMANLDDLARIAKAFTETVTPGSLKAATKVTTPVKYIDEIAKGERALMGLKAPWAKEAAVSFGKGKAAAKLVDAAFYGKYSPVKPFRGLLSKSAGMRAGLLDEMLGDVQRLRDRGYVEQAKVMEASYNLLAGVGKRERALFGEWDNIAKALSKNSDKGAFNDFSRMLVEWKGGLPAADDIARKLKAAFGKGADDALPGVTGSIDDLAGSWHEYVDALRWSQKKVFSDFLDLGGQASWLDDAYVDYFTRGLSPGVRRSVAAKFGGKGHKFWQHRRKLLQDFPGGTAEINAITRNRLITATEGKVSGLAADLSDALTNMGVQIPVGTSAAEMQKMYLMNKHLAPMLDDLVDRGLIDAGQKSKYVTDFATDFGDDMLSYFRNLPEQALELGLFGDDLPQELLGYMTAMAGKQADLRIAHQFLRQQGVLVGATDTGAQRLTEAWARIGFNERGLSTWVKQNVDVLGYQSVDDLIANAPASVTAGAEDKIAAVVRDLFISEDAARTLTAYAAVQKPKEMHALTKFLDQVTSTYRGALTVAFPSFHTRNIGSGYFNSVTDGQVGAAELLRAYRDLWADVAGKGAGRTARFIDEAVDAGMFEGHGMMEMITGGAARAGQVPEGVLGGAGKTLADPATWKKGGWKPWAWHGGFVKEGEQAFGLAQMGNKLYDLAEYVNRGAYYEALRRKGFDPGQAMYWVKRSQFNYRELSRFEKDVMRRITPFWGWIRNNVPYQVQKLLERPGGMAAQTYRTVTQTQHGEESYVPSFLREMMGIRIGGEEKAAHFIRQGGIPIEDFNRLVMGSGLGLPRGVPQTRTFGKMAAQMTPFITAPMEMFAGRQMWSGRKFEDMISPTERATEAVMGKGEGMRMPLLDRLIAVSPASRFLGEGMAFGDPRKSWWMKLLNATTGVKISTYDTERWKYIDLINQLRKEAGKSPVVREGEYFYVPERYRQQARGQEDQALLRILTGLEEEAKKLREKREREEARR